MRLRLLCRGRCDGADFWGEQWALSHGIPVDPHPADWDRYNRQAGPIRNSEMAQVADALIYVGDGTSTGTADMIRKAQRKGLRIYPPLEG